MKRANLFIGLAIVAIALAVATFGQLSPPASGGSATPSGPAGGGLAGTYPNPTVASVPATALPNPSSSTLGGIQSIVAVAHNFLTSISTSGVPVLAQPGCADLSNAAASCSTDATVATNISSGTLPAGRLPNPSSSTLGGTQSIAAIAHNFLTTLSTAGAFSQAQPACADLSDAGSGCSSPAGALAFPFAIVQSKALYCQSSTPTFTWPQATAASGNTLWIFYITSGNTSVAITGYTRDLIQADATNNTTLAVLHKTAASDTNAAVTTSGSVCTGYMLEMTGTRTLDVNSTSTGTVVGSNTAYWIKMPTITPTAGSAVFGLAGSGYATVAMSQTGLFNPPWQSFQWSTNTNNDRPVQLSWYPYPATGAAMTPPTFGPNFPFSTDGFVYSSFSIK